MAKKYYWLLAVFILIYLITIFVFQADSTSLAKYHVNAVQLKFLGLTVALPLVAIWFAAFYSIVNVSEYTKKIKGSPDGDGFTRLVIGLTILGLNMPVNSIISRLLSYGTQQNLLSHALATIVSTHLSVLFYLFGFFFLFIGSRTLVQSLKKVQPSQIQILSTAGSLVVISVLYIIATLSNSSREVAVAPATIATYYMTDWLIVTTIVLPYIAVWGLGFYTALLLHTYQQKVGGKIYRASLAKLSRGFFVVILSSILLQFLTSAATSISGWGLGAILSLVYVLLAVIAVGYVLIALGAKGLAKLEEVT